MPITNPFGDDSDESDDGFTNPFASKKAVPAPAAAVSSSNNGPPKAKANTSTNPFGGDNADIPKEPPTLQKKSLHNNLTSVLARRPLFSGETCLRRK